MDVGRAVASMVGATVVNMLEMRAAHDDRGQPRANFTKIENVTWSLTPLVNPQNCNITRIRNK